MKLTVDNQESMVKDQIEQARRNWEYQSLAEAAVSSSMIRQVR